MNGSFVFSVYLLLLVEAAVDRFPEDAPVLRGGKQQIMAVLVITRTGPGEPQQSPKKMSKSTFSTVV
ncbi:hypothetical protein [Nocardiopsis algeriensis]|uniref:Uncharacterized protein n=1 Tax=Nocardiopsis algeriensis TaxID=1478215 RepID=A0A841IP42_9ACTN|nr:hypothetical protein [Nocardiopsis algeriensis]MBB6120433.1 hypothetical protein [Nocardiopsis algeriensis]